MNPDQIRQVARELSQGKPIDHFWYDGHTYKLVPIYKGWYRTGYKWVIDEAQK